MPAEPPTFHLTGARVLTGDTPEEAAVGIARGLIVADLPGRAVHLPGWLLLPGIVDLHGDGFERHVAPRRGAMKDLVPGLLAAEAELAASGITTAVLAQFWSWEGGMRGPDFARALLVARDTAAPLVSTDLRVQLRVESHLLDDYPAIEALVTGHAVPYVVFNDHLPHAALAAGRRPPRLTGQALKSGRSPEAHLALMQALHDRTAAVPEALAALAGRLAAQGVLTGSHDEADAGAADRARALGLRISEFPESEAAARAARAGGAPVILGAPNVLRGGSHAGKVSAAALVGQGLCDALASDYHYPAPARAALHLANDIGLAAAWALVASGPARVLGLADRGAIAPGLRADLVAINPATGLPGLTVAGGRVTHADRDAAAAMLA